MRSYLKYAILMELHLFTYVITEGGFIPSLGTSYVALAGTN